MTTDKLTRLLARIEADTKIQGDTRTPMTGCAITHDQWQAYMTWRSVSLPLVEVVKEMDLAVKGYGCGCVPVCQCEVIPDSIADRFIDVLAKLAEVDCP